uniref:Gnk2-homologous domain-containing protein n=1 Tax=Kalanchoe fedtschenkoi TaxID=63787 RepID=A0A7N0ZTJ6_KALFE
MSATIFAILILVASANARPDTTVALSACNLYSYSNSDPFADSYAYVINDLQNVTPNHDNFDYYMKSPYQNNAVAYGHGKCNAAMSPADCVTCIISARAALEGQCLNSYGGRLVMVDCMLRYEAYQFTD